MQLYFSNSENKKKVIYSREKLEGASEMRRKINAT